MFHYKHSLFGDYITKGRLKNGKLKKMAEILIILKYVHVERMEQNFDIWNFNLTKFAQHYTNTNKVPSNFSERTLSLYEPCKFLQDNFFYLVTKFFKPIATDLLNG